VEWEEPCADGLETRFIQIFKGGVPGLDWAPANGWPSSGEGVDNGRWRGRGTAEMDGSGNSAGVPYYEAKPNTVFSDDPNPWGPSEFEVCRLCLCNDVIVEWKCKQWKKGKDGGKDLKDLPSRKGPSDDFIRILDTDFPGWLNSHIPEVQNAP